MLPAMDRWSRNCRCARRLPWHRSGSGHFPEHRELRGPIRVMTKDLFALCESEDNFICGNEKWLKKYEKADYKLL